MKKTLALFALLIGVSICTYSQKKHFQRPNAIFESCIESDQPIKCFELKIRDIAFNDNIKKDIRNFLLQESKEDTLYVNLSFIVDLKGKVIKETINPPRIQKDIDIKIINAIDATKNILPGLNEYGYPILRHHGSFHKLTKVIIKKFNTQKAIKGLNHKGSVYSYVYFKINKEGEVDNMKAFGPSENFEKVSMKSVGKAKQSKSGIRNGKPVSVSYAIPLRLFIE